MSCGYISMRLIIYLMLCLNAIINNIVRSNMSIVILTIVKPTYNTALKVPDYGPRYEWSAHEQSLVIGSFFWGQLVVTVFAGVLAERYGARRVTGYSLIVSMILSVLVPISANVLWLLITVNFFLGIGRYSSVQSSIDIKLKKEPEERGKFLSSAMANAFGIVINWTMSSFIIRNFGWHYVFYAVGTILALYTIAWWLIVYDSPNHHPQITVEEKEFILSKLNKTSTKSKHWPPFRSILSSVPVWALVCFHFGNVYMSYFCATAAPKFLSEVHKLDISTIGALSSIPYLIRFPIAIVLGTVSDFLYKRKLLTSTEIRKGFSIFCKSFVKSVSAIMLPVSKDKKSLEIWQGESVLAHFIPCLLGLFISGGNANTSIALFTIVLGSSSAATVTSLQNPFDLSPNFSTTVFAFMHTIGSSAGFIAPMVVAHVTKEKPRNETILYFRKNTEEDEWRHIFFINSGIVLCTAIIFLIFGRARVQKWNKIVEVTEDKEAESFVEYPTMDK